MLNRTYKKILFIIVLITLTIPLFAQHILVYTTPSGNKYHLRTCHHIGPSAQVMTLEEATRLSYQPCGVCKPPVMTLPVSNYLYKVNERDISHSFLADTSRMVPAFVERVVDGDTIRVRIENPQEGLHPQETIRLIGVDTPETIHPFRAVEYFGKEASRFTKTTVEQQQVYLAFDWDMRDVYQRLLAYVYLPNGLNLNALIIQHGYGHAYTTYPFQFMDEFTEYEKEARSWGKGLWGENSK